MRFVGKRVVVTGAASGIGRATALRFAAEGANVVGADIDEAGGASLVAESHDKIVFKPCDVSRVEDIRSMMDFAAGIGGGIDVVFNNAGAPGAASRIDEISPEDWDKSVNLLFRSIAMGIRFAAPHMKGRNASIINTASIAGVQTGVGFTAYGASKAGVLHLTKLAAADLARHGIRVNSVSPGLINTNIYSSVLKMPPEQFAKLKAKFGEAAAHAQPVARTGVPEDVAAIVLFLASEEASFITGTDVLVDGGFTLGERHSWDPDAPAPFADVFK